MRDNARLGGAELIQMSQPVLATVHQHRVAAVFEQERTMPLVFRRVRADISPGPGESESQAVLRRACLTENIAGAGPPSE